MAYADTARQIPLPKNEQHTLGSQSDHNRQMPLPTEHGVLTWQQLMLTSNTCSVLFLIHAPSRMPHLLHVIVSGPWHGKCTASCFQRIPVCAASPALRTLLESFIPSSLNLCLLSDTHGTKILSPHYISMTCMIMQQACLPNPLVGQKTNSWWSKSRERWDAQDVLPATLR